MLPAGNRVPAPSLPPLTCRIGTKLSAPQAHRAAPSLNASKMPTTRSEQPQPDSAHLRIVCISPRAEDRAHLTLMALREAYDHDSQYQKYVSSSVKVTYDSRDADRKLYAPAFTFNLAQRKTQTLVEDCAWKDGTFDRIVAMAAMSDVQGADLLALLRRSKEEGQNPLPYAINGAPGFNVGFSRQAAELTNWLKENGGLVEDVSRAAVMNLEEHAYYFSYLPPTSRAVACRSRVAFPFTMKGKTADGCGPYGRMFTNEDGMATERPAIWFALLAQAYSRAFRSADHYNEKMSKHLQNLADACSAAELDASNRSELTSGEALDAMLSACAPFMDDETVNTLQDTAETLAKLLVREDARVGVNSSRVYDAKLVLADAIRHARSAGLRRSYSDFGLDDDGSTIKDAALVNELILSILSLHLPAEQRYNSETRAVQLHGLLADLQSSYTPQRVLFLCDTGVDPNEDDVAAILMQINLDMLARGLLPLGEPPRLGTARPPPDLDRLLLTANSCKKLHLCDAWVLDEHVSTLAHKLRAPDYACITSCYLDRNMLGDGGLGDLSRCIKAGGLPRCAYFSMSQNRIGDEGLRQLAQAIEANKMAEIVYLNLSSNRFGNAGASAFANAITFGGLPKLKTLSLDTNLIADKGMRDLSAALATATAAPALRCFEVASNRMGGAGLEALMMMVVARQGLQPRLDVHNCRIGLLAPNLVSRLHSSPLRNLHLLDMRNNRLSDASLKELCLLFPLLPGLLHLSLCHNFIGDAGVELLCHAVRQDNALPNLAYLGLNGNYLGDASFVSLATTASAGHFTELQDLFLLDVVVNDAGLLKLCEALKSPSAFPNLATLNLSTLREVSSEAEQAVLSACESDKPGLVGFPRAHPRGWPFGGNEPTHSEVLTISH